VPTWAALDSRATDGARLVVVERAQRDAFEDGEIADWIRDARRLSALEHPNVARVRDVVIRRGDVLVVSEFVDGVRWGEFATSAPLETALRVLVDALTGLSAIHTLRDPGDPKRQIFKLVHGGLTPDCVVVGLDGIARVVGASRPRSATARLAGTGSAYLAPEVLLEDESADSRADIYSVGVLLWEALSRKRFLPGMQPSAIVTQLLSGRVPAVTVPEASPWAAPLAEVAMRALSADPQKRFSSAAAMAAEVRRIGALKLPLPIRLAAGVREAFGEAAKARRAELERGEIRPSAISFRASGPPVEELIDVTEEAPEASQTASTVPPPVSHEATPRPRGPAPVVIPPLDPPPLAVVAPPAPALVPPRAVVALAPAPPARVPAQVPSARADADDQAITTAAPFALATSARLAPAQAPAGRPKGTFRIVAGSGAVLVIGAATFWVASRGPATHAAATPDRPPAIAPALNSPRETVTEAPAAKTADPTLGPTTATADAPANAPPPPPAANAAPAGAHSPAPPAPVLHAPLPASPVPARPKRSPAHREYDPQGI
jgi:hypothetical protein